MPQLPAIITMKSLILRFVRRFGYEIINVSGHQEYDQVTPTATYSPWNVDEQFKTVYQAIRANTLVDRYKCYELWKLVEQSAKLEGALIEVGVWRGGSGALIAQRARQCGIQDPVYLCDTYTGIVKAGENDPDYRGGEHADTSVQIVEKLVQGLGISNVKILQGIFPDQSAHRVDAPRFRFCHVDVDVYQSSKEVTQWVWDRLVVGGIVAYDDYGFKGLEGVRKFVEEQRMEPDRIVIHNLNGHAIVIKIR
ncbi:MAG TPA: TylF/MycF/NovP-related O-methyltransferase [Anaerolineales bacterium]